MGLMPSLLMQKYFNKALVSELGPKAVGCNANFAGTLTDEAAQSVHF